MRYERAAWHLLAELGETAAKICAACALFGIMVLMVCDVFGRYLLNNPVPGAALAAAGEAGVQEVVDILKAELDNTLALIGCASIRELDRGFLALHPPDLAREAASIRPRKPVLQ